MAHFSNAFLTPLSNDSKIRTASHSYDESRKIGNIAQLLTINPNRLQQGDKEEASRLSQAAKEHGIFYLDLQDWCCTEVIDTADEIFAFSKKLFSLSEEEKMKYDIDGLGKLKLNG